MKKPRIYADFQKWTQSGDEHWLILQSKGTFDDLKQQGLELKEGLEAVFYADDADDAGTPDEIEADGVVKFDPANGWVAAIDENKIRHASDKG
jgi:hypothetical protein